MNEEKIINGYYQSNIKTSRNEDSVYAMKYASQQMLINKLQQENARLKEFKKEHEIMKKILIEKGLWETLLNDDRFLEYLREEN